ncbi:tRNA-(ms(2)io(6)A)-hydroxylase [Saliniradius amylolyticus]|uniref:tRNA-(Ms(2)io(6)A)-hydroxylase n=1 Tax=Saliniradius amylolyticus TaxID=2183582 RepID=A0A2S2E442_9ALTE|nr:tRNA isopentenyl-2-thiomethyl-A-37 hydroxylase MiaE [Saliniradius amylolyticus]AWL12415.1 tRNA-(ms(2)io(6)A)-hydroxylase [Saliniradius amylolyticus]
MKALLAPINAFLHCKTPDNWLEHASRPENLPVLLIDHANCELKAAQTAVWLMRRYAAGHEAGQQLMQWLKPYEDYVYRQARSDSVFDTPAPAKKNMQREESPLADAIIDKMMLLVKEELHHFQQVVEIMQQRGIRYRNLPAARYARGLMKEVRTHEPAALVDRLICGAYIEARSCERFARLAPLVDRQLEQFYISLLRSEARHFEDYLSLAQQASKEPIEERVRRFGQLEASLIEQPDEDFKFHSGIPLTSMSE